MQGYVTEIILTLEAIVEALDGDPGDERAPADLIKSTPNLKDATSPRQQQQQQPTAATGAVAKKVAAAQSAKVTSATVDKSRQGDSNQTMRGRSSTESDGRASGGHHQRQASTGAPAAVSVVSSSAAALSRSRSAQSLKLLDQDAVDDRTNLLVQMFWICMAVLESDYEHEFLLAARLLEKVMDRLPLDRPDVREKLEKLQAQLKWANFPGVHSLLLKGCTNPNTHEATVAALSKITPLLAAAPPAVVDPPGQGGLAFAMNVIALLPYMVLHYENANDLCIRSAEHIAQVRKATSKSFTTLHG